MSAGSIDPTRFPRCFTPLMYGSALVIEVPGHGLRRLSVATDVTDAPFRRHAVDAAVQHTAAMEPDEFEGRIGRYHWESEAWWPPEPRPPDGAPNVLLVVLDDVGYAQLGCFGSDIATPEPRRAGRRRAPLRQLPHHRAVLPHPRLRAHRPQPPQRGHGSHRRPGHRLPRLRRAHPAVVRAAPGDAHAPRLRRLRGRQVAPHAGGRGAPRRRAATAGRSAAASSAGTASSPARPTSSSPR